jgi:ABC-2 type transport system permease protein
MNTLSINAVRRRPRPKYLALSLMQIQQAIAYPVGTLIDILTSLLSIATVYYLWRAVFAAQPQIERFDWHVMQAYVLVSNAIFALLGATSTRAMIGSIRTGAIVTDLLRPYSYITAQFAQVLGRAATQGALGSATTALIGFVLLGMAPPPTLGAASLFLLSVGLSFLIAFLINFLLGLLCFWTKESEGLLWAQGVISFIFSGGIAPLHFLPYWLQIVAFALPFQGMIHTPLLIYLGAAPGRELWAALLLQVVWVVVLGGLVRLLWGRALRRVNIQGG